MLNGDSEIGHVDRSVSLISKTRVDIVLCLSVCLTVCLSVCARYFSCNWRFSNRTSQFLCLSISIWHSQKVHRFGTDHSPLPPSFDVTHIYFDSFYWLPLCFARVPLFFSAILPKYSFALIMTRRRLSAVLCQTLSTSQTAAPPPQLGHFM